MPASPICQCAELTPAGRGAIGSLLIYGPTTAEKIDKLFRPQAKACAAEFDLGRIYFGRWQTHADRPSEELVLCRIGHDEFEVHCHGGRAAVQAIRDSLVRLGCQPSQWQTALTSSEPDPITSEAMIALASASTARTAAILLDQLHGSLRRMIQRSLKSIEQGRLQQATEELAELIQQSQLGLHLTRPWRVVLAGRPNVGKSSLVNAILGYTRAIVFDQPGTTRDVLAAITALDGWPIELTDTAGVRIPVDEVERQGVARAAQAALQADLVVLVYDASAATTADETLHQQFPDALLVANKSDLCPKRPQAKAKLCVSATTGENIAQLTHAIACRLVPQIPDDGIAVPFTQRQVTAIQAACQSLQQQDPQAAISHLLNI